MRRSLRLFEHILRVLRRRGEPHGVAFHLGDQPGRDVVMPRALAVGPLRAVVLGQLDAVAVDMVDRADMNAVGADHLHMLADIARIGHRVPPLKGSTIKRAARRLVALAPLAALASCAHEVSSAVAHTPETPGFLLGLWHGFIFPVAWVLSLFMPDVAIYAVPNNGGWYDFGYFLGIMVFGVGAHRGGTKVVTRTIYRERR